jgi:hypothetical protein
MPDPALHRSRIKPWKVKKNGAKSAQGNVRLKTIHTYIEYCALENLGWKIQCMICSGLLIPWAFFHHLFLLLDFQGCYKYRSGMPKQEKTPMSRLPETSLDFPFGHPVTSLEVQRQSHKY